MTMMTGKQKPFPPIQQEYGHKPNAMGYTTQKPITLREFWQKQGWGGQSQLVAVNRTQPSRRVSVMTVESLAHGLLSDSTRRVWAKQGVVLEQFYEAGVGEEDLGEAEYCATPCTQNGSKMKNSMGDEWPDLKTKACEFKGVCCSSLPYGVRITTRPCQSNLTHL